jgi:DNA-binding NarL/FixJ family response regulator
MATVAPRDRSDGHLGGAALSIACIASAESAARAALTALEFDGLLVEGDHLGSAPAAVERLAAGTDIVLVMEAASQRAAVVVQAARRQAPDAGIVVVVPGATPSETRGLLAAGTDAVVVEGGGEGLLAAAVRSVSLGQICIPRPFRECLDRPALSHRESQILALVSTGCTNSEIAHRLCLSESTVKAHLSSVFRRLGVRSRRKAAALFASDDWFRRTTLFSVGPIDP